jgi:hypothetical protein
MHSVRLLTSKGTLQQRSDKCGRNAVAGDVGDENAKLIAFESEEIVEIAGDSTYGEIASSDLQASDTSRLRKNSMLDSTLPGAALPALR